MKFRTGTRNTGIPIVPVLREGYTGIPVRAPQIPEYVHHLRVRLLLGLALLLVIHVRRLDGLVLLGLRHEAVVLLRSLRTRLNKIEEN